MAVLLGAALMARLPAWACYSGLVIIPTTDVAGAYTWTIDVQWQGLSHALKTDQLILNTEIGIGDRFEAGIDVDASSNEVDRRALFNAKCVLLKNDRLRFAVAGGVQNVTSTFTPHPYLVASKEWRALRVHFGVQREAEGKGNHAFFGVDRCFGEHWQVMADHTAGPENYSSAGIGWSAGPWQIVLGGQWPNEGGKPIVVLHVVLKGTLNKK
jgi:hypothetical protein